MRGRLQPPDRSTQIWCFQLFTGSDALKHLFNKNLFPLNFVAFKTAQVKLEKWNRASKQVIGNRLVTHDGVCLVVFRHDWMFRRLMWRSLQLRALEVLQKCRHVTRWQWVDRKTQTQLLGSFHHLTGTWRNSQLRLFPFFLRPKGAMLHSRSVKLDGLIYITSQSHVMVHVLEFKGDVRC